MGSLTGCAVLPVPLSPWTVCSVAACLSQPLSLPAGFSVGLTGGTGCWASFPPYVMFERMRLRGSAALHAQAHTCTFPSHTHTFSTHTHLYPSTHCKAHGKRRLRLLLALAWR